MQSKIGKPVLFFAGLLILLFVISILFKENCNLKGSPYEDVLSEPTDTLDYLVIGDSECASSISPMEIWNSYGYTGYNCGVPGQQMQDTYYMLEEVLQNQSPKVVLLETNIFYRNPKFYKKIVNFSGSVTKRVFSIFEYHNLWKYFSLNADSTAENTYSNPLKGLRYNTSVEPYSKGPYIHETGNTAVIDKLPLFYLNKIVELCDEQGIQLILYSVPSPLCWSYAKHNRTADFAEANNLAYVDLNLHSDELGIDWSSDTRDHGDHLNFCGAKKVTNYMGEYLSQHCNLTDHRHEENYSSWNDALSAYLKQTNQTT